MFALIFSWKSLLVADVSVSSSYPAEGCCRLADCPWLWQSHMLICAERHRHCWPWRWPVLSVYCHRTCCSEARCFASHRAADCFWSILRSRRLLPKWLLWGRNLFLYQTDGNTGFQLGHASLGWWILNLDPWSYRKERKTQSHNCR